MAAVCVVLLLGAVPAWRRMTSRAAGRPASAGPPKPTPRWPDGTVNFGAPPGEKGNWDGGGLLATNPNNYEVAARPRRADGSGRHQGRSAPALGTGASRLPALQVHRRRAVHALQAVTRSAVVRHGIRRGAPEYSRQPAVYLFLQGGSHTFRTIYMDGRPHPGRISAELPGALDRSLGRRHAGHRHGGHQRDGPG